MVRIEGKERCCSDLMGRPEKGDHLEAPGLDKRTILTLIYKTCDGDIWTGLVWIRVETGGLHL